LLDVLPPESPEYRYNMGEYSYRNGNVAMGEVILQEVLDTLDVSSPYRARTAHHLASIARGRNDLDSYRYYLALAAESDLRTATLETVALQELGDLAFAMGDSERAHKYLATALLNARECATPMRAVSAANSLPIAEQANRQKSDRWQRSFNWMVAILVTVVIILVLALLVLRHEIHNMKEMEHKLRHANNAKEIYIGQFLQLCSIYMDKLNRFSGIAARKLAAGQADELHALLKSGKFVEEHSNEFFRVFDNAFLNIYPDFINEVNRLMRPECRIEPRNGELLNTDLRILAFMRLGIDESARIAQILNYSVNTIYAYRNRLRSRAIDKDGFEKAIMGIAR
ncbi:MAG: hypothetical protein K2F63_07070, partial [Muribaculaceae bacterium]|nr:hypothetical protein [Muribaculaceae bacterium]